MLVVFCDVLR